MIIHTRPSHRARFARTVAEAFGCYPSPLQGPFKRDRRVSDRPVVIASAVIAILLAVGFYRGWFL